MGGPEWFMVQNLVGPIENYLRSLKAAKDTRSSRMTAAYHTKEGQIMKKVICAALQEFGVDISEDDLIRIMQKYNPKIKNINALKELSAYWSAEYAKG